MKRELLRLPALRGGFLALLAAVLFGISTPAVQRLGAGLGAFTTAALLYAGAAVVGALSLRTAAHEARLQRSDAWRLLLIRPCEVLSRVANVTILEVANNALRVLLQHRHVIIGSLA